MMNGRLRYIALLILISEIGYTQHFQFSQFYAAPTYLNPAFTGANVCARMTLNYRSQWAGVSSGFTTYQASFDHSLYKLKSGIGIQVLSDVAGIGSLRTTQINFLYAYETKITKKIMGRAGISVGDVQRKVDADAFTFGDQIARNNASSSVEDLSAIGTNYFDAGSGILIYTSSAWAGFAANHINTPNQSLMGETSTLPVEFKFHGGYKYFTTNDESTNKKLPSPESITFAFNYKKQQKFNQIDLGLYYSKSSLVIGLWYRGIPIFKPVKNYVNNDAIIFLFGLSIEKFKIGYSYDLTLSKLSNLNTKGSHELSMAFQFCSMKKRESNKKKGLISCPKF